MVDYVGVWGMTKKQHEDFYIRWRQLMAASSARNYNMVANPEHAPYFKDLMERLVEDPMWVQGPPKEMMFVSTCPRDELVFWRADTGAVSLQEMIGRTGLGRFSRAAAPTREGVKPLAGRPVASDMWQGFVEGGPAPLRGSDEEREVEKLTDELERQDRDVYGDD